MTNTHIFAIMTISIKIYESTSRGFCQIPNSDDNVGIHVRKLGMSSAFRVGHLEDRMQMPIKNFAKLNQLLNPGLMKSSSHVTSRENIIASRLT